MVSRVLNLGLRGFEFFCALIVMALVGNMIATAYAGNSAMVNYDMFVSVFGMLSLLYLLPTTFLDSYSVPIVNIALDVLNVLFWFCGAVATAAYLHVHSCSNSAYTHSNHITNGSPNTEKRCREAQASTAFLWFGWAAFTASMLFSLMSGRGSANLRGGIRRPAMSQV
ncbi:hypothetical protein BU26DRAFT_519625 [Trematosphaeria pertusa]|uniref:MARVEL domain-containing protein n=1 Tax=Trematosphaeria pertusa TaxID=390896 RepID=A0A6A6IC27_9PLEO|nr:uncharacterized protein BU26DRAFT_519625 [Trematosphaeria pertusa]KAF2247799.1 hypothetical protein BU26DRAFT_519625 [Trematosphaeria pertusa]